MAGLPSDGRNRLFPVAQPPPLDMALPRPGAAQIDHLKVFIIHIQTGAEHLLQLQRSTALIEDTNASCDHIYFLKNRVGKHRLHPKNGINQRDLQSLHFFLRAERSRKALQLFLSPVYLMGAVEKLASHLSFRIPHVQTALPIIPDATGRIFHRKAVQKRRFIPFIDRRSKGRFPRPQKIVVRFPMKPFSVIDVPNITFRRHTDQICSVFCI